MKKTFIFLLAFFANMGLFAQQPVVAVAPFDVISGVNATNAAMITDVFFVRLNNTKKVTLVTRSVVNRVIKANNFQAKDWVNEKKTSALGKALNADWIIQGNIRKMNNDILVTVQFYNTKTLKFESGADARLANVDEAYDKLDPLADKFIQTIEGTTASPAKSSAAPNQTYNIGDFGPAGGIIFYDKGVFSNGWRYLEAAPTETEFTDQWGAPEKDVAGLGTAVGSGKRNTELIIEQLKALEENGKAAQLCASLNFDGYTDWFLPSKDELNLMYKNLKQKGLGGFSNEWYWSSSQVNNIYAWTQNFNNSYQNFSIKHYVYSIRAVRAF